MKNLKEIYIIYLILQNRLDIVFAVKIKNFTENKLNQEDQRNTRLRKWLPCQRYILLNSKQPIRTVNKPSAEDSSSLKKK